MGKSTLVAGPFIGEMGWELFCWQGRVRRLAKEYDNVHIFCREGHEVLYEDFAEVNNMRIAYGTCDGNRDKSAHVISANEGVVGYDRKWTHIQCRNKGFYEQDFIPLGKPLGGVPSVILHARARTHRSGDNWGKANYIELIALLHRAGIQVGTIGHLDHTEDLSVDKDYRGLPLRDVCNILSSTKCLVGTSSGPIHLGSLCKTPHVVLTADGNIRRYNCHWNPFLTAFRMPAGGWHPKPSEVFKHTVDLVEGGAFNKNGTIK